MSAATSGRPPSTASPAISRASRMSWAPCRCRSCGPAGPPPNSGRLRTVPNSREAVARAGLPKEDLAKEDLAKEDLAKKGAARGCKRPKSREETPKEGSGNAMRYRTATSWPRIAQKASEIDLLFIPISHGWAALGRDRPGGRYCGIL